MRNDRISDRRIPEDPISDRRIPEDRISEVWPANLTHPKSLLLLSYMRSGSSFVGDIFHHTPNVFYIYEPLDPLYVAMYGSADGWVVPADIYYYPNTTHRLVLYY